MKTGIQKSSMSILALVMVVNALAYGTIIPLLYPYAERFGITPLSLGFMFASFSLAQFLSTPVLGRISDRIGRKPMLLLSLFGTSLALALFASAQAVWMLFVARILDGITGGNISIAQAMIADSTEGKDRAKAFGLLGAAFGFGFLAGPAIGGLLSQIHLTAPFWFSSALALIGTLLGVFFLKETLPPSMRKVNHEPLFQIKGLTHALLSPVTGTLLLVAFLTAVGLNSWIIGFQSTTVDVFRMTPKTTGLLFAGAGLVSILMQGFGIRILLKVLRSQKSLLMISLIGSGIVTFLLFLIKSPTLFSIVLFFHMAFSAPQTPMVTALISEKTKGEDQGGMLGITQSYVSLGQIVGPLLAGAVASFSVQGIFLLSSGVTMMAAIAASRVSATAHKVDL